jgi:DNA-binding LacI/PurR family transcriptional regulator
MGYLPNVFARSLSTKKSNILRMVVPKIIDIFYSNIVESMFDITLYSNYTITFMVSQENPYREKNHLETLLYRHA